MRRPPQTFALVQLGEMNLVSAGASSTDEKRLSGARKLRKRNKDNVQRATSSYGARSVKL